MQDDAVNNKIVTRPKTWLMFTGICRSCGEYGPVFIPNCQCRAYDLTMRDQREMESKVVC